MTTHICPRCQKRYNVDPFVTDFVHECNSGNTTLDQEDILKVGDWEDYTGSGKVQNVMLQGSENKLWGTRADVEGEDVEDVTRRGARGSTHRQRQHFESIELSKGGKNI